MSYNTASPSMKRSSSARGPTRQRGQKPQNTGQQQNQVFDGLLQNERLVNSVTSVVGCTARVTGKSGKSFEGIFRTISPEGSLVLGKANQVEEQHQNGVVGPVVSKNDMFEQFVINKKDWVHVDFQDVNLEECYVKKDTFKTDGAIGKKVNGQASRELQKWDHVGDPSLDGALEETPLESAHSMANGWSAEEMLTVNVEKFGVKSTYKKDMEEYTTKLVKHDTPEFRDREKYAAQKAEEIMNESRFERTDFDSGRTEEQLYSSVVRTNKSSQSSNWRERSEKGDSRIQKVPRDGSGSPAQTRKEPVKVVQVEEAPKLQVKEKVAKPVSEAATESKPETNVEGPTVTAKDVIPAQNVSAAKPESPQAPAKEKVAEPPEEVKDPKPSSKSTDDAPASVPESKIMKDPMVQSLKKFGTNFQLASKPKSTKKTSEDRKVLQKEQKKEETPTETAEESQPQQENKPEPDETSVEKKTTSTLNPNAMEFRPVKRNTPSPRSTSTPSSGGAPSPFQGHSPYMPQFHGGGGMYNRPRHRGPRPDYMESPNYVNANSAAGQPFFAQQVSPYMHGHPPHSNISYLPGNIRPHGMPAGQPVFLPGLPPNQGPIMVPMGQMGPGPYGEPHIYYSPHAPVQMLQSPPQIPSPSMPQSHFNFPNAPVPLTPNVRPVSQMPAQAAPIVLQPQQIITSSRPPPPQASNYQGN